MRGCDDAHPLVAPCFAGQQLHLVFCYTKSFGQKSLQMRIGFAVYWWGGNVDFQLVALDASDLVTAGLGLDA